MPYQLSFGLYSTTCSLENWRAQLLDTSGVSVGSPITTGFASGGVNTYFSQISIANGYQGGIIWYGVTSPTVILASAAINPVDDPANLLDLTSGIETNITMRQALRLFMAVLSGKADATTPGQVTFKRADGVTVAVTVVHDTSGNRTTITAGTL